MSKRIWFFSELYYPEQAATGYFLTHIAEHLARTFPVHVLCAQPTYLARGTKAAKRETHNGVEIRRCAGTTFNKNILAFRLVNLASLSVSLFFHAVFSLRRNDVVLVVTNPPSLPFVSALACWIRGARFIIRIEDLYPEALVAAGVLGEGSIALRILHRMMGRLYATSELVIVLGRDTQEVLRRRYPAMASKFTLIHNWADLDQIVPMPREGNVLLRRLGLEEKFIVQYSGNMGRTHDLETVVQCAVLLRDASKIHFLLIGWGAREQWLRETCSKLGLSNVTILPPLPRDELCLGLNGSDVAIVPLVHGMNGVSVPSRMYNVFAAGKPLIACADQTSEIAQVVVEEKIGWAVPPGCPDKLAEIIRSASDSPALLKTMSAAARRVVEEKYSPAQTFAEYLAMYRVFNIPERDDASAL